MTTHMITIPQTAEILGVSPRTVRRYAVAGLLTIHRDPMTGRVHYDTDEVVRLRVQMGPMSV